MWQALFRALARNMPSHRLPPDSRYHPGIKPVDRQMATFRNF
jgi:hypothetical protein